MEIAQIIPHVEALIFASDHPLPEMEIVDLLNNSQGFLEDLATLEQVQSAIEAIHEKYQSEFYSFELKRSGGGFQFLTKPAFYPTVAQLNGDKYLKKLSVAALETLSIIAYKQPITKSEIESIRGVNSDYSIQKLLEKELIIISGRKEEAVGKPLIYATSKSFMDYFGLNSPEDLPQIKEVLQEELAHPTLISEQQTETKSEEEVEGDDEENGHLAVSETGELLLQEEVNEDGQSIEDENDEEANAEEENKDTIPDIENAIPNIEDNEDHENEVDEDKDEDDNNDDDTEIKNEMRNVEENENEDEDDNDEDNNYGEDDENDEDNENPNSTKQ